MIKSDVKNIFYKGEKVDVSLKIEIPAKFYKYQSISNNGVNNLIEKYVHFSHPNTLNDIMDGSPMLWDMHDFYEELKIEQNSSSVMSS